VRANTWRSWIVGLPMTKLLRGNVGYGGSSEGRWPRRLLHQAIRRGTLVVGPRRPKPSAHGWILSGAYRGRA
jgi:hypothetical protein